jgi:hypothetical protein
MAGTDLRQLPRNDQLFLGTGALVFIASFLPWYGVSYNAKLLSRSIGSSASTNAWHGLAAFGLILILAATLLVAVMLLGSVELPVIPVSWGVVVLGLDALGALFVVIKSVDLPTASAAGFSVGLRWGGWLLMIFAVAQVVVAALRFRDSGEAMPWAGRGAAPPPSA